MVLLHLLNAYREAFDLSLIVAHVNHGFRPEESEKEAEQKPSSFRKSPSGSVYPSNMGSSMLKNFKSWEGFLRRMRREGFVSTSSTISSGSIVPRRLPWDIMRMIKQRRSSSGSLEGPGYRV